MTASIEDRIAELTVMDDPSGCWLWSGALDRDGYARIQIDDTWALVHRVVMQAAGAVIDDLEVDHLCRVRRCVNPAHLEPVTRAENNRRRGSAIASCPQGHSYDSRNTYLDRRGHRHCRECNRAAVARYAARRAAARQENR